MLTAENLMASVTICVKILGNNYGRVDIILKIKRFGSALAVRVTGSLTWARDPSQSPLVYSGRVAYVPSRDAFQL